MDEPTRVFFDAICNSGTKLANSHAQIKEQIEELIAKLESTGDPIGTLEALYGYAGFDATAVRKKVINQVDIGDIVQMVITFLMRGNNIDRILKSLKQESVKSRLTALKAKLAIKNKAGGASDAITLGRISLAFPEVAAMVLYKYAELPGAVTTAQIRARTGYPEYPSIARMSGLTCLLPHEGMGSEETNLVLNAFLLPNMMLSEVINVKNQAWKDKGDKAKVEETIVYQTNAYNSKLLSEPAKIFWCKELGMIVEEGGVKRYRSAWTSAGQKAKAILIDRYGVCIGA